MNHNILVNALFDFPGGWFVFVLGGSALLLVLIIFIIVLEALVLFWFRYGTFWRSLGASCLMNIFSSILGYFAASFLDRSLENVPGYYGGVLEIIEWFLLADSLQFPKMLPATMLFLLISWVISIVSEGGILVLIRAGHRASGMWLVTLVANILSYILLLSPYIWIFLVPNSRPQLVTILGFVTSLTWIVAWVFLILLAYWWIPIIGLLSIIFIWWQVRRHQAA